MDLHVLLRSAALIRINLLGFTWSPLGTSATDTRSCRDGNDPAATNSPSIARLMLPPGKLKRLDGDASHAKDYHGDINDSRRGFLTTLLDISPPGLWPVGDDQDSDDSQRTIPLSTVHSSMTIISNGLY